MTNILFTKKPIKLNKKNKKIKEQTNKHTQKNQNKKHSDNALGRVTTHRHSKSKISQANFKLGKIRKFLI